MNFGTSIFFLTAASLQIVIGLPLTITYTMLSLFCDQYFVEYIVWITSVAYMKICLWLSGIKVDVIGLDKLDLSQNYVFACNHQSFFDIIVMYSILPYHIIAVSKQSLAYMPIFGTILKLSGSIFIDKTNTQKSIRNMNNAISKIINNEVSVLIFPEGTRSCDNSIQPFKTGASILAIQTGIPIVPVSITGCQKAVGRNINIFRTFDKTSAIKVIFATPIKTTGLDPVIHKYALTEKVYSEVCKSI